MIDTTGLKPTLLQQLGNGKHDFLTTAPTATDWQEQQRHLTQKVRKYKDSAQAFAFIAGFSLLVMGLLCLAAWGGYPLTPDLKSGALFLLLTLCNMGSAFVHRLRLQKLQHQLALVNLMLALEKESRPETAGEAL